MDRVADDISGIHVHNPPSDEILNALNHNQTPDTHQAPSPSTIFFNNQREEDTCNPMGWKRLIDLVENSGDNLKAVSRVR